MSFIFVFLLFAIIGAFIPLLILIWKTDNTKQNIIKTILLLVLIPIFSLPVVPYYMNCLCIIYFALYLHVLYNSERIINAYPNVLFYDSERITKLYPKGLFCFFVILFCPVLYARNFVFSNEFTTVFPDERLSATNISGSVYDLFVREVSNNFISNPLKDDPTIFTQGIANHHYLVLLQCFCILFSIVFVTFLLRNDKYMNMKKIKKTLKQYPVLKTISLSIICISVGSIAVLNIIEPKEIVSVNYTSDTTWNLYLKYLFVYFGLFMFFMIFYFRIPAKYSIAVYCCLFVFFLLFPTIGVSSEWTDIWRFIGGEHKEISRSELVRFANLTPMVNSFATNIATIFKDIFIDKQSGLSYPIRVYNLFQVMIIMLSFIVLYLKREERYAEQ